MDEDARMNRILRRYKDELMARRNVVGVGIGHKRVKGRPVTKKAIIALVTEKMKVEDLPSSEVIPHELEGVATDVVEVGLIKLLDVDRIQAVKRTSRVRPAPPGVSIGHYLITAGTLGAIVTDTKNQEKLILSNNHVLANITDGSDGRASAGDPIYQPGPYDGGTSADTIARLLRLVPIVRRDVEADCKIALFFQRLLNFIVRIIDSRYVVSFRKLSSAANLVDAAVARPINPSWVTPAILEIGNVAGYTEPKSGMKVRKSGRTSAVTSGEIVAVNVSVNVRLQENDYATFEDQIVTTPMSQPGDSGSLVVDSGNKAVGLLFAGSDKATVCNRFRNVADLLSISI